MTLDELNEAKAIAKRRDWLLEHADYVEWAPVGVDTVFGTSIAVDDVEDILRKGVVAECRRRVAAAEARLRELGVVFPGDVLPLPSGTAPKGEPLIPVTFRVDGTTAVKAAMKAGEVERLRAACQAADDGYRVEA